jgi:putative ABC transport system permease protein
MARRILAKDHPKHNDYELVVPLELLQQAKREKRIWNMVLGSIGGISLLVGGIGIMNIMLTTVTERTREIGVRRALGAKKFDISMQFLAETVVLSSTGGLVGIALGTSIPILLTHLSSIQTALRLWTVLLAFAISVGVGVVFGMYPAAKAADMDPIDALRHE